MYCIFSTKKMYWK